MDQNLDPNAPTTTPAATLPADEVLPSSPAPSGPDPAYVAQLERYVRQQQAELNRYEPIKEDAEWMLADESRRESIRKYRDAYETASKPQRPPELEALYAHIEEQNAPIKAWISKQEAAETTRQTTERQKFESENLQYAARLQAEKKLDQARMVEIAAYADTMAARLQRNVGLEEAYKTLTSFGERPSTPRNAPVLRAEDGAPGVPGESTTTDKPWLKDFNGYLVAEASKASRAS